MSLADSVSGGQLVSVRGHLHVVSMSNISSRSTPLSISGAIGKNMSCMGQGNMLGGSASRMSLDDFVSRRQLVSERRYLHVVPLSNISGSDSRGSGDHRGRGGHSQDGGKHKVLHSVTDDSTHWSPEL